MRGGRSLRLSAEDDERTQREDAEKREDRRRDRRPPSCGARTHRQRREESEDHQEPEHDPYAEHLADGSGDREEDQEDRDQDRLEDREVAVRRFEADGSISVDVTPRTSEKQQKSRGAREGRRDEHAAERPTGVAPHRLVRHGEENAGLRAYE